MPADMAEQLRAWQDPQLQIEALLKPPANNVEAERRANKAKRVLEQSEKKHEEAEGTVQ